MLLKKHNLAIAISFALVGSLTACSGGSNQSSPVSVVPKTSLVPETPSKKAPEKEVKDPTENPSNTSNASNENSVQNTSNVSNTNLAENSSNVSNTNLAENTSNVPNTNSAENTSSASTGNQTEEATKQLTRQQLETLLDPNGKTLWRQAVNFVPSSDTAVNNPLKAEQNGKISPQIGAAAYFNGRAEYQDGSTVKDFRNAEQRSTTTYDPSFMTRAEINPHKLQHLEIQNSEGKTVANIAFVNQQYSSYNLFKAAEIPMIYGYPSDDVMNGYLAVPTNAEKDLRSKGKATYRGHTLTQKRPNSSELHLGDIELNADFDTMKISGKLTNRDDVLLDSSVKYESEILDNYTSDKADLEDYPEMKLATEAEIEAMFEKEYERHRKVDVTINPTEIKAENGVVSFNKYTNAYSYQHENRGTITPGVAGFGGIFAGDNAQEVVGELVGGDRLSSFGATEVQKEEQK